MKTKIFTLLLAVVASIGTMFAENSVKIGNLYYNLDTTSKTAEVTTCPEEAEENEGKYSGDIIIPTSVSYAATTYSVTSIRNGAFIGCTGLTSIEIPNSVTSIGAAAFYFCTSLTSIDIPNSVTTIGYAAFWGCTGLTCLIYNAHVFAYMPASYSGAYTIPDGIESIAGAAFDGCGGLTSVTIPHSVTSIGDCAFCNCEGLKSITCYATYPPELGETVFSTSSYIPLYVPAGSIAAYQTADQWNDFKTILPIEAKEIETNDVKITPSDNSIDVAWPVVSGAETYELVIKDKSGNVICTLVFNANGQLQSIAFNAPGRNAVQQTQSAGFAFTVTGLDSSTAYDLTITAKNSGGSTLDAQTVSFTTTGEPQGLNDINTAVKSHKLLRDGQIFIFRGDKTYTLTGAELK